MWRSIEMNTSFEKSFARGEPHAKRQARERAKKLKDEEIRKFFIQEIDRRRQAFLQEMADPRTRNSQEPIFAVLPRGQRLRFQMYADEVESDDNDIANLPW